MHMCESYWTGFWEVASSINSIYIENHNRQCQMSLQSGWDDLYPLQHCIRVLGSPFFYSFTTSWAYWSWNVFFLKSMTNIRHTAAAVCWSLLTGAWGEEMPCLAQPESWGLTNTQEERPSPKGVLPAPWSQLLSLCCLHGQLVWANTFLFGAQAN